MIISRSICLFRQRNVGQSLYRKFRISSTNHESTEATQPQVKEEKFAFEDLQVAERVERRKPKIEPFMKNVFVSVFNRDLLAYPEILNKEESEDLDRRVSSLREVFSDPTKTKEEHKNALKNAKMYAAPVPLTSGGLAANQTESLNYLEAISSDVELSQQLSDHWVALQALKLGLNSNQYQQIIGDLIEGEYTIALCIKEKISERVTQADFRTVAQMDGSGIWHISGEKFCLHNNGYLLVLCLCEGERLNLFLVHPGAEGVSHDGSYIKFRKTPAIPLSEASNTALAHTLALSRLHAATLCRCSLQRALHSCIDYVTPRAFSGKPLHELSSIRATIGDALLDIYASESAEYFTAGLLDGYLEPDAELEMAMCRNFMANHGIAVLLKILAISSVEMQEQCNHHLQEMLDLTTTGETLDSVNMYVAMNGIQHAGTIMAQEIKQMRNPLYHPAFIIKKTLTNRYQEKDQPKLTLYLAEHLHPSLRAAAEQLEYCVLRMKYACETLLSRHGIEITTAYTELNRLAEAATEILAMTAVLARASRSYCIGVRNSEVEMKLASCIVDKARHRVRSLILEIDEGEYINMDHVKINLGKKVLENKSLIVEKPTSRVFW